MARLKDMLEPGETVIRRYPPRLYAWLLVAIVVVGLPGIYFIGPPLREGAGMIFLAITAPIVPFFLIAGYLGVRWRILVTNKRILARLGMASLGGTVQIQRAEIEEIDAGDSGVGIRAAGRLFRIPWVPGDRRRVMRTLDPNLAEAGGPAGRITSLLEPGEVVVTRTVWPWSAWLPPEHPGIVQVIIGILIFIFADGMLAWFGLAFIAQGIWPAVMAAQQVLRTGAWWTVATDRRLLWRTNHDHTRYDDMALTEIDTVEYDGPKNMLLVQGAGKSLETPATNETADRIRAAIETAKGAAP